MLYPKNMLAFRVVSTNSFRGTGVLLLIVFALSGVNLYAQDTIINRNISVEREYKPVIQDAGKVNSLPKVFEPKVVKEPASYSDFNLPLNADYNIHTLPVADLAADRSKEKNGYARIGFGTYLNSLADVVYPLINQSDMLLNASLNHTGTLEASRFHTNTKAGISFEKLFKNFNLYAAVGGSHEALTYYGTGFNLDSSINLTSFAALNSNPVYTETNRVGINNNTRPFYVTDLISPTGNTFWRLNGTLGLSSLSKQANEFRYQAEINYNLFSDVNGVTEHMIHSLARINSPLNDNRIGIDADLYNMGYQSTVIPNFNFWSTYSILDLNPYYSIEREKWNLRLGFKSAFSFVHGDTFLPSADIAGEWRLLPKLLSVYGGISGGYEINSEDKIFKENPFLYSDLRVKDTYTPVKLLAGIKLKPAYNLAIDAFIDFRAINDQYFFVNKGYTLTTSVAALASADSTLYSNRFNVVYSNATLTRIDGHITYNPIDQLNFELSGTYNGWNVSNELHAWNKPAYEVQFNAGYKIDDHFSVSIDAFYEGGRYSRFGNRSLKMNDKMDINPGLIYHYDKQFSGFLHINNVLNSKYQDFCGYDVQGINFLIGGSVSF